MKTNQLAKNSTTSKVAGVSFKTAWKLVIAITENIPLSLSNSLPKQVRYTNWQKSASYFYIDFLTI